MAFSPLAAGDAPSTQVGLALRPLTAADAAAAAEIIRAAFAAQPRATEPPSSALRETTEIVAGKIAAGGGFGALAEGRLVAVALWQADGETMVIGRVCVLTAWRGRSLGARLIAACESEARTLGLNRARLRVRLALPENERLFARLGYARAYVEAHPGFDAPTVAALEKRIT
jgi:predicted N-acetyltransferase YhbS